MSTSVRNGNEYVYSVYSGTSMAVPHVSGVAALVWSHHSKCSNTQIRYAMAKTAKDLNDGTANGGQGCDDKFGYGLVQALAAHQFLNNHPCNHIGFWSSAVDENNLGGCNTVS